MKVKRIFCYFATGPIRNVFQVTAEVVDKEYCQARKPENRFKVILARITI